MAITGVGAFGTAAQYVFSETTIGCTSAIDIQALDWIIIQCCAYNSSTTDGDNSEVSSVVDNIGNTYTKLGEYTNSNGAAGSGLTTSLWMGQVSRDVPSGEMVITFTFASAITHRCVTGYVFRSDSNLGSANIILQAAVSNATDGSNDFGSVDQPVFAPTESSVLYYRALGKIANSASPNITPTSAFTVVTSRASHSSAARVVYGEWNIDDSDAIKTSNPTLAVSGDTAGVFAAIYESDDFTGDVRLTQQHAMVAHSTDATPVRMTQQGALVVHESADFPVRLTQIYAMVIHSRPPTRRTTLMGNWI